MVHCELIKKLETFNEKWRNGVSLDIVGKDNVNEKNVEEALNALEYKIKEKIEKGYKVSNVKFICQLFDYDYEVGIGFICNQQIDFGRFDKFIFNIMESASKKETENTILKDKNKKLMFEIAFLKWVDLVKGKLHEEVYLDMKWAIGSLDESFKEYFADDYEPEEAANIIIKNIKKAINKK